MGIMADTTTWTADRVRALDWDQGLKYELLDGELVVSPTPKPPHFQVVTELTIALAACIPRPDWTIGGTPCDISWGDTTLVQPDVWVSTTRMVRGITWAELVPHLALVVEVLSPRTARYDKGLKRQIYQRERIPTYWILDPEAELAEVWTPDADRPEIVLDTLTWQPDPTRPPFSVRIADLVLPELRS